MRLVAAGAEDGAADGEDAGERGLVELEPPVFDEAAEAVAEADDLHAVKAERGFADAADGGVQAGAVAAGGQDADAFGFGHCLRHYLNRQIGSFVEKNFSEISNDESGSRAGSVGLEPSRIRRRQIRQLSHMQMEIAAPISNARSS